ALRPGRDRFLLPADSAFNSATVSFPLAWEFRSLTFTITIQVQES
ncbi:MAG: hypothetical protein H6Q05_4674, partial [Acidobacteria bacterium]|nr:hypothetical protein [Acidobacteriota bacterium]